MKCQCDRACYTIIKNILLLTVHPCPCREIQPCDVKTADRILNRIINNVGASADPGGAYIALLGVLLMIVREKRERRAKQREI